MKKYASKKLIAGLSSTVLCLTAIPFVTAASFKRTADKDASRNTGISDRSEPDTENDKGTEETKKYAVTLASYLTVNAPADTAAVSNNTCTIKKPGVFTVTGKMTGGQIVVDVDKDAYPNGVVELELCGMNLTNTEDSPICVESIGKEVVITSKKGTENTISDGMSYTNNASATGAIYSKDDLKFKGKGTLTVNGNYGDAIVSKNDIKIQNGTLIVNAVKDGIRGKDSVTVGSSTKDSDTDYSELSVKVKTRSGDGIKSTGKDENCGIVAINGGAVDIDSYADGIQAKQFFVMNGGDVSIKTYEGADYLIDSKFGFLTDFADSLGIGKNRNKAEISAKGIKASGIYDADGKNWLSCGNIDINGGNLTIDSSDDCISCGGDMNLTGGVLKLASSDDGIHSEHMLTIGQGDADTFDDIQIIISKAYEGIEGQQIYQNSGTVIVDSTDDAFNVTGKKNESAKKSKRNKKQGDKDAEEAESFGFIFNGGFAMANVTNGDHDGFDSNGDIVINGGYIISNGNEPFDCDDKCSNTYNGGVFVSDTDSDLIVRGEPLASNVSAKGSVSPGTRITLCDSRNNVIVSFIAKKHVTDVLAGVPDSSGVTVYTGGTLSGETLFQTIDETQTAAYGGKLTGGTAMAAGSGKAGKKGIHIF